MKTVDISVVSALGPHLQSDTTEPLFVTKDGHTVAAIMPASDEDVESLILSVNPTVSGNT